MKRFFFGYDTVIYNPGATVSPKNLGDNNEQKSKRFRTFTWANLSRKARISVTHMSATHNMQFAARGTSEPADDALQWFEEFSVVNLLIDNSAYDPISLATFLPVKKIRNGASMTNVHHTEQAFELPQAIIVPQSGNIEMTFDPADNLTTAAAGDTNPVTDADTDRFFWVKFEYYGVADYQPSQNN